LRACLFDCDLILGELIKGFQIRSPKSPNCQNFPKKKLPRISIKKIINHRKSYQNEKTKNPPRKSMSNNP
jgi:hypothetical protein